VACVLLASPPGLLKVGSLMLLPNMRLKLTGARK
jgi:hypothetical protein